jgi:DNA-binding NarL/FixJ family response regulator
MVVDDHPIVLKGVRACLETEPGVEVVGEAQNGRVAVERAKQLRPDVVLMDLEMPRGGGIAAIKKIHHDLPETILLAFTMHQDNGLIHDAFEAGAVGYVLKSSPLSLLMHAIDSAVAGKEFVDPNIKVRSVNDVVETLDLKTSESEELPSDHEEAKVNYECQSNPASRLTTRENEILRLLVQGLTMKETAMELGLSPNTLIPHMKHIYSKLGVHSRGQLIAKAVKDRII